MKTNLECIPCQLRQAREAISHAMGDTDAGLEVLRKVVRLVSGLDWNVSAPALAQQVHRRIRELTHNPDPYAAVKERMNRNAVRLYPGWSRRFKEAHPALEAAVRLAIVGNLMDVGPAVRLDEEAVNAVFHEALSAPLLGSLEAFADAIGRARSVLYLADNAGEIVFDRDLLAQMEGKDCTVAVRGCPVLNDATLADAEAAGLPGFCKLVSNGSDAPGTLLEDCSPAFRGQFAAADLVIAKGQGNFESLAGAGDPRVFFLLKVKCPVLARSIGCPHGGLLLKNMGR